MERKWIVAIVLFAVVLAGGIFSWKWNRYVALRSVARDEAIREMSRAVRSGKCDEAVRAADAYLAEDPNVEEILVYKGGCLFDAGRLDEARQVFTSVLSRNPENAAAKNYLERLEPQPGGIDVMASEIPMTQVQFEKEAGLQFSGILTLTKAVAKASSIPKYLSATYVSSKNFADTVAYVSQALKKSGFDAAPSVLPEGTVFAKMSATERRIVSILKGSKITVTAEYLKLQ